MMPNIVRGGDMNGLMLYLGGPGKANEHTEQHVVAGDSSLIALYGHADLTGPNGRAVALAIANDIDAPRRIFGTEVWVNKNITNPDTGVESVVRTAGHVWHASLSLDASEGHLPDATWEKIANDFVDRMGFTGEDGPTSRWIAVRHGDSKAGNDHIHIAVSLVREDGTKASVHNDQYRAQTIAGELEVKYGLKVLESRQLGTGSRGYNSAELATAKKTGQLDPAKVKLERIMRAVGASSPDEMSYVAGLKGAGILARPRFAEGGRGQVIGYSVALRAPAGKDTVWYGGGTVARDLTLPRLRANWAPGSTAEQAAAWTSRVAGGDRLQPRELPHTSWDRASVELSKVAERLRSVPVDDRQTWVDTARDVAGVYAAWSYRVEGDQPGPLRDLARDLGRTAGARTRPTPAPRTGGLSAETGMLMMVATGRAKGGTLELMIARQLAVLAETIIRWQKEAGLTRTATQTESRLRDAVTATTVRLQPATTPEAAPMAPAAWQDPRLAEIMRLREVQQNQYRKGRDLPPATPPPDGRRPNGDGRSGPTQDPGRSV